VTDVDPKAPRAEELPALLRVWGSASETVSENLGEDGDFADVGDALYALAAWRLQAAQRLRDLDLGIRAAAC
jgi:hypothetical protein